jgi:cytochrome c
MQTCSKLLLIMVFMQIVFLRFLIFRSISMSGDFMPWRAAALSPSLAGMQEILPTPTCSGAFSSPFGVRVLWFWILLLANASILSVCRVCAHPLQAEPVDHAYVFTFDQFYLPEDTDEHVTEGGFLLLAELNCTACHTAPPAWEKRLRAKAAPRLTHVTQRLDEDQLWLMIRRPQFKKKGSLMPNLFTGSEAAEVEALITYLKAVSKKATEPARKLTLAGDAARGKQLYHQIGCVACHDPASDYRPGHISPDYRIDRPGNASVPIVLAEAYDVGSLAAFLLDPAHLRPAGRMPNLRLTEQEAADIADYLHLGREPDASASEQRQLLNTPPQQADYGRQLWHSRRCVACHGEMESSAEPAAAPPTLLHLHVNAGCLDHTEAPARTGLPRYDLNDLQRRALRLALQHIQLQPNQNALKGISAQIDWQLSRQNCYACHDHAGKGGPEEPRGLFLARRQPPDESPEPDLLKLLPPSLDEVARRKSEAALMQRLFGLSRAPLADRARMPQYLPEQLPELPQLFHQLQSTKE